MLSIHVMSKGNHGMAEVLEAQCRGVDEVEAARREEDIQKGEKINGRQIVFCEWVKGEAIVFYTDMSVNDDQ